MIRLFCSNWNRKVFSIGCHISIQNEFGNTWCYDGWISEFIFAVCFPSNDKEGSDKDDDLKMKLETILSWEMWSDPGDYITA